MNGKKKIEYIFVVLTPFHYKCYLSHYKEKMDAKNVLILKESYLDISTWNNNLAQMRNIPNEKFSIYNLRNDFFTTLKIYRNYIKKIKQYSLETLTDFDFNDSLVLNIGSDRDIFTQIFINTLYESNDPKLIAFEEGIGFYDKKSFFESLKAIAFPLISPLILGEKLYFNKPMGRDKRIDQVYCRFPDLIPRNGFSEYKKSLVRENNIEGIYNGKSQKALIFSFPSSSIGIPEEKKINWVSMLYEKLNIDEFVIKLHPREEQYNKELIKSTYNWSFLEGQFPIESLNYFEYKYIINFNSSIILDILSSAYPKKKIITISLYNKLSVATLYEQTNCISLNNLLHEDQIRL